MTNEERIEAYRKMIADREAAIARMQLEIADLSGQLSELGVDVTGIVPDVPMMNALARYVL